MGSQHLFCISLVQDRRNVAILATATGVLATPIKTIAVIAPGIIIVDTHESQTRALGWLGIANSGSVVNSIRMSNGCLFVPVHIQSHQRTVSQVNTYPIYVYIYIFFLYIYISKPMLDDQSMSNDGYVSMSNAKFNRYVRQLFRV